MLRLAFVSLFLALVAACAVSAGKPPARKPTTTPPFRCFTQPWADTFDVLDTRYDRKKNLLVWLLRAKKDARLKRYEAFVGDGDGVELATVEVKFEPAGSRVKAKDRLRAVVRLGNVVVADAAVVNLRERR
jgi:hypothetical protein